MTQLVSDGAKVLPVRLVDEASIGLLATVFPDHR
jgi:hypothetical protein